MFCGSLKVLLWKHFKVRLRRYINTIVELIAPILLLILIVSVKNLLIPPELELEDIPADNGDTTLRVGTEPFTLDKVYDPQRVVFTPKNNFTTSIMESAAPKLHMLISNTVPRAPYKSAYGTSNETIVNNYLSTIIHDDAVVIFEDTALEEIPKTFKYTIRMKNNFMTKTIKPFDNTKGPHESFVSDYEPFLKLQWALDSSYLKLLTKRDITQQLEFEEIPSARGRAPGPAASLVAGLRVVSFLSLLLPFVRTSSRLLEERSDGIRELLKMYGVSSTAIDLAHFINALPAGAVYCTAGAALVAGSLVREAGWFWILLFFALQYVFVVSMAFPCSYILSNAKYSTSLAFTVYCVLYIPASYFDFDKSEMTNNFLLYLSGLWPNVPLAWFWYNVADSETQGEPLSVTSSIPGCGSPLLAYVYMAAQSCLCLLLAWYLERVRPGKYGVAKPWYFIFQWSACAGRRVRAAYDEAAEDEAEPVRREYFEEPPAKEVGIHVENVVKDFGSWYGTTARALHGVSFDVYRGEITVLLGHNGAGKTTIMSIISGMLSPTRGAVRVAGRGALGLCPQHNLNFRDLTVLEHAVFFSMLKGAPYAAARRSAQALCSQLGLAAQQTALPARLSGGMLRRLQLACALAGDARVLLLDEPTSGLDVATRRALWDLLLSLRGERTVLLTTHFMEEADALGDRVLLLSGGRLRCHATPMHLKKAIGSGYRLTLVTDGPPREWDLTRAVTAAVPDATVQQVSYNSVTYTLPARQCGRFPTLFAALEAEKAALAVQSIGVGVTTLEEVFLQLCKDQDSDTTDDDTPVAESDSARAGGVVLLWQQTVALLKRQALYTKSHWMLFLILQVALPIASILVMTHVANNDAVKTPQRNAARLMDPGLYGELPAPRAFYRTSGDAGGARRAAARLGGVRYTEYKDGDTPPPQDFLFGVHINDTHLRVQYTSALRHAAPVALNFLANALAPAPAEITAVNDPVEPAYLRSEGEQAEVKNAESAFFWCAVVVVLWLVTAINTVSLACKERACGSRHIHIMAGCSAELYWLAALAYNVALYTVVLVVPTAVAATLLDQDQTFQGWFLGSIFLSGVLGLAAIISFSYLVSLLVNERSAATILICLIFVFGVLTPPLSLVPKLSGWMAGVLRASVAAPPHAAALALARAAAAARRAAHCRLHRAACPRLPPLDDADVSERCCATTGDPYSYTSYSEWPHAGEMLVALAVQTVVYMTLVLLTQHGVFNSWWDRAWSRALRRYQPASAAAPPPPVAEETAYVAGQVDKTSTPQNDLMLVDRLHKVYYSLRRAAPAVAGISFSVKRGECFGLLGVNGAGKSTTFRMLTAEECATRGRVYGAGYYLHRDRTKYLQRLGYCPQFFGLDTFLTGRENLALLLALAGCGRGAARDWIAVVGLEKYADRRVSAYSGGCVRRLGCAAALSAPAPLALLDEPTSGVDPAARRRVHAALRRARRAVVVTSHSMDEMEALCGRIAIMRAGRICALGSPAELRAAAAGHAVRVKLAASDEVDGGGESSADRLKRCMLEKFPCQLKDEHKTMLHYQIKQALPYARLFADMERVKADNPVVEDYSVAETTLEEVFLALAAEPDATDV